MLRVVIALPLAGCFAPAPATGLPCADGEPRCPDGLVCVQQPSGVETCETGPGEEPPIGEDRDSDGVADLVDNCPDAPNREQADEDGDNTGDVCDVCPPFAGDSDTDLDGVGDACDPNPETPGDVLVSFNGFAAPVEGWAADANFMALAGEGLAMANDMESALVTLRSPAAPRVEVRTQARLLALTAIAPSLGAISIVEQYVPQTDQGVACQLSALANSDQQQLRIFNLDTKLVVDTAPHTFQVGAELDLRLRRTGETYACRATAPVLELAADVAFMPPAPRVGLRVRGASAIVHWVMVVSSP
jgi:hypothetical protein